MFEIEKLEKLRGFRLTGEMDLASEDAFNEALASDREREGDLTLDLSALTFIDSVGVLALIKTAKKLQDHGRLILHAPGKTVRRIFELMRVDTVPNVQISEGEAPEEEGM